MSLTEDAEVKKIRHNHPPMRDCVNLFQDITKTSSWEGMGCVTAFRLMRPNLYASWRVPYHDALDCSADTKIQNKSSKIQVRTSFQVRNPIRNSYFETKTTYMKVADLQLRLHQVIDAISDSEKLEAVYTLLKGQKGPFKPMSVDEYVEAIDESRQQIIDGKYLDVDELKKESDEW